MRKFIICIILLVVLTIGVCYANTNEQENGFQILKVSIGASAAGRGGAVSALPGNATSLWYNPAAVSLSDGSNFCFSRINYLFGVNIDNASIIFDKGKSSFGFGLTFLNYGKIDKTDGTGNLIGEFHPTDLILAGNHSWRLSPSVYFGYNIKLAYEKIDSETSYGLGADLGMVWDTFLRGLNLSAVVQNVGYSTKLKDESIHLPLTWKCGANYSRSIGTNQSSISLSSDIIYFATEDTKCNLGLEFDYTEKIFTRVGYALNYDSEDISAGLGLKINSYQFDYAFTPYSNDLGNVHRISLTYNF
ncbi:MAG: PorV/PorQ family protein [Candidatus Cloacimonadota bacterium]|nr:PorV/PorQ family protein [Candidatus Cloacimonadota bacterium]